MSAVSNCFQRRALEKVVLKRGLAGNGLTDGRLLFVRLCLSNSLTITSLSPALVRLWLFIFQVNSYKEFKKKILGHLKNIAEIAKTASHKLPGKSSLNESFVLSWPDPMTTMTTMFTTTNMTTMTVATMKLEVGSHMMKLEVVHKEVGGCLISYNLRLANVRK